MSWFMKILGGSSAAGQANVDANFNLNTTLPATLTTGPGFALLGGSVSTAAQPAGVINRAVDVSAEGRIHVAEDRPVFYVNFAGSATSANAIPQDVLKQTATTMTATAGSPNNGFLRLNASAITTVTTGVAYQSYATFPTYAGYGTRYEWEARTINAGTAAGKVIEMGAGYITSATSVGLLDGFCFRWTAAGEFRGVLSINGVETTTAALTLPSDNVVHRFRIIQNQDGLLFFVDNVLQAQLSAPTDSVGPGLQPNPPILLRVYNNTAPALAPQLEVAELWVSQAGIDWGKPWHHIAAGMGQHSANVPFGTAIGETGGNVANASAIPATAAGTNTTALVTGLGGVGRMTAQATNTAAAGDMIATSYQVPVASATQGSKRLHITGVRISSYNGGVAVATTSTNLLWGLAWGHTAVSLATADAVGAKAPRHIKLGFQYAAIAAVVGQPYSPDSIAMQFQTPIVVNPGEFIATTVRFILGTATASQEVVFSVAFEGYWE